jgi:predicted dehydrogenase
VADVRQALEDKSLDAISIAAPNHWHSLMTIWAAQAGKHVYVEKPMSHDVQEGRVVVEAQKKYGVVIQHGTQSRSSAKNAGLHELITVRQVRQAEDLVRLLLQTARRHRLQESFRSPGPSGLEPVARPRRIDAYHGNYVHYNWHWFWETGNGDLNNQGTHQLDMAYWALDKGLTNPIRAMAIGGRFLWNDQGETPNTMLGIAEYPNGQYVFFNVRNVNYDGYQRQVENEYYFEDGGKIIRGQYYPKGSDQGEKIGPGRTGHAGRQRQFHRRLPRRRPPNGQRQCRRGTPQLCPGPPHEQLVSPGQRCPSMPRPAVSATTRTPTSIS